MLYHPANVLLKVISVSFKIHSACCGFVRIFTLNVSVVVHIVLNFCAHSAINGPIKMISVRFFIKEFCNLNFELKPNLQRASRAFKAAQGVNFEFHKIKNFVNKIGYHLGGYLV